MRSSVRVLPAAFLAVVGAVLDAGHPRPAFAVEGAVQNPANGHWYKHITNGSFLSWDQCRSNADSLGGSLLSITSAEENQWIVANILPGGQAAFIGAWDPSATGAWQWVNGDAWSYTNWQGGMTPPPSGGEFRSRIVGDGTWDAVGGSGGVTLAYIVEWGTDPNEGPPPPPPEAPSGLVASVSFGNPIVLRWNDNSDNEASFEVERRTGASTFLRVAELGPNCGSYEDVSTNPGTAYTYRVRAVNSGGASDYTNEATATASSLAPAPRAPTDLMVVSATRDRLNLFWVDNSVDEIAFEVHRRAPEGEFEFVASVPPDSWSYTHGGLVPDGEWVYGVRAVNAFRTSGFCECEAATLPTLAVTALRADLKDSPKFGKDSMKVQALFDFLPASPDALFDPLAEGITLRAGDDAHPVVMTLPGGLDTWKVKGTKATWKSAKGSTPKYMVQVDLEDRLVKASATGLELVVPAANPMRVSVGIGNDAGTVRGDWEAKKPGTFRLR